MARRRDMLIQMACCGALALAMTAAPNCAPAQDEANNRKLPIELDVSDPNISKAERLRRHREVIRQAIEERKKKQAEAKAAEEAAAKKAQEEEKTAEAPIAEGEAPSPDPNENPAPEKDETGLLPTEKGRVAHATLFLTPGSVSVVEGLQFVTECKVINTDHVYYDRFRIVLDYPEAHVKPVAVHQDQLADKLKGEPACELDVANGLLVYEGELTDPENSISQMLVEIVWEALAPGENLFIYPLSEDISTTLWMGELRVSSSIIGEQGGSSGAFLRVLQKDTGDRPAGERYVIDPLNDFNTELADLPDQSELSLPKFWIKQPAPDEVEPGKWYVVDFGIDNPGAMAFDELRMAARYDPDAIELADSDENNFIQHGKNVLDGPFLKMWGWDHFQRNGIYPSRGYFDYRVSTALVRQQGTGAVARAFIRVKKAPSGPLFEWIWNRSPGPGDPTTGLYLMGENLHNRRLGIEDSTHRLSRSFNSLLASQSPDYERADPEIYRF